MFMARNARLRARRNTYIGYRVSCAAVWAVILAAAQRVPDPDVRRTLRLACAAWWSGWTSASIARVAYPPPSKLGPTAEKRLGIASLPLIALGLANVIRLLIRGRRPASSGTNS